MSWAEDYSGVSEETRPPWLKVVSGSDNEEAEPALQAPSRPVPVIDPNAGFVECIACGKTKYPSLEMNARMKVTPHCPECGYEHPQKAEPVVVTTTTTAPGVGYSVLVGSGGGGGGGLGPTRAEPSDPITLIEARLLFLEGEIEKLSAYTKERTRLRRMLKAARR